MDKILELRRKAAKLVADARGIIDTADADKRSLTSEEETRYDVMLGDVDKIKTDVGRREKQHELEKGMNDAMKDAPKLDPEERKEILKDGKRLAPNATDAYRSAFTTFLRSGVVGGELRDLQADVDDKGGFLLAPEQMINQLIKEVDDQIVIAGLATSFTVANASSLGVPSLDADPSDPLWTAELGTGDEDDTMRFGKRELKPHPLAKRIKISNTLLRKAAMGAEGIVRDRLGYKFSVATENAYMTGDGVGKPLGLFTPSANGISTARDIATDNTANNITSDNLVECKYALKGQYWSRARWLFHRDAIKSISKLKDLDGQYIWQQGLQAGQPDRLLGFPVLMSEFAPNTFTTGKYVGMFADFSAYWVARSQQLEIQRLVELYAEKNQTGFIGRWEGDAMPVLEEPFVRVTLA